MPVKEFPQMYFQMPGYKLHYVIDGQDNVKPWLVMGHSLACNLHMWDYEAKYLAKYFQVLRLDQRGHGLSEDGGSYTLETLANDFKAVVDHLGIRKLHWMGLSLGGMIGQTFALNYPEYMESLVLCNTASRYPQKIIEHLQHRAEYVQKNGMEAIVEPLIPRWFSKEAVNKQIPVIELAKDWIRSTSLGGFTNSSTAITHLNTYPRLPEIKLPTLIFCGDEDINTPPELSQDMNNQITNSKLVTLQQAGHLGNLNSPVEFKDHLLNFYQSNGWITIAADANGD